MNGTKFLSAVFRHKNAFQLAAGFVQTAQTDLKTEVRKLKVVRLFGLLMHPVLKLAFVWWIQNKQEGV